VQIFCCMEHCKYQVIGILSVQLSAFPAMLNCCVRYSVIQSSAVLQHWMIVLVGPRHDRSVDQLPLTRRPDTTTLGSWAWAGEVKLDANVRLICICRSNCWTVYSGTSDSPGVYHFFLYSRRGSVWSQVTVPMALTADQEDAFRYSEEALA